MVWAFLQDLDISYSRVQGGSVGYDRAAQHSEVMNHEHHKVCDFNTSTSILV